ncbi:MAG TPA: tyrosine-type recombinase/integrase [Ktedonobacteraceae bacterium]|nr:tyrosine-type recombinase/integrase [Ktedonobacteraceae bacterium]
MASFTGLIPANTTEDKLIDLWLRLKKSAHTRRSYSRSIRQFQQFVRKPLREVTLEDAIRFCEALAGRNDNTQRNAINAVKSFYSFACRSELFPVNVMASIEPPSAKSAIHKRLLPESIVVAMIMQEPDLRNHCILRLLYSAGLRVSELCNLTWEQVSARDHGGYLHIVGKRDKTRDILLNPETWAKLQELHAQEPEARYVFVSRQTTSRGRDGKKREKGERMDDRMVRYLVRAAAKRVGITNWKQVSPHWLRHCHGTHAIRRGATLPVVRDTLGHSNLAITNIYAQTDTAESSSLNLPL